MKAKVGVATILLVGLLAASVIFNVYQYRKVAFEASPNPEVAKARKGADQVSDIVKALGDDRRPEVVEAMNKVYSESNEIFNGSWFGVNTLQNPMDAWITQEIMYEVKPDFVIECGTYKGGSAILWASMLMHINPAGRVITIDIEDQRTDVAVNHPLAKERVDFILGGSTDPATVAKVAEMVKGKKTLVILDSLHTAEHVAGELAAYGPMVPVGSYILCQDTAGFFRKKPEGWPWKACLDYVENSKGEWIVDRKRERLLISNNIDGYLRRVKGGPRIEGEVSDSDPAVTADEATSQTEPAAEAESAESAAE